MSSEFAQVQGSLELEDDVLLLFGGEFDGGQRDRFFGGGGGEGAACVCARARGVEYERAFTNASKGDAVVLELKARQVLKSRGLEESKQAPCEP